MRGQAPGQEPALASPRRPQAATSGSGDRSDVRLADQDLTSLPGRDPELGHIAAVSVRCLGGERAPKAQSLVVGCIENKQRQFALDGCRYGAVVSNMDDC